MAAETKSSTPRSTRLPQWTVEKFTDDEWHILSTYEGQPVRIADVYDEADAHLAAEAPAMFKVLSSLELGVIGPDRMRKVVKILSRVNRRRAA